MLVTQDSWQSKAAAKVASTKKKIPTEWLLQESDLKRASEHRDITGPFIESFLDDHDITVIRMNSLSIVESIKSRKYTSLQVTKTFCKTAAIAYQLVCNCCVSCDLTH